MPQFRTLFGTRGQRRDRFLFRLVFKLLFLALRLFRFTIPVRFTPDLVEHFFKPCKGSFRGSPYDAPHPPPIHLGNATICEQFQNFISHTIVDWVSAGVLAVWGRVGEVGSPHLVFPLTIEPSKPRLCHDERFLNLWIRDLPFKLDHLLDLPRYVLPGHFQTSFDDRSGYQHVLLHPSARTYFGFQWNDVYFVFCTFPFECKASACIYHNLGLAVTSAARSRGIPVSQYIDDRHVGQLFHSPAESSVPPSRLLTEAAACIMCYLLLEACYFIGIGKSQWFVSLVYSAIFCVRPSFCRMIRSSSLKL